MSIIETQIPEISDLALQVMKRAISENELTATLNDPEAGPIALASALSDFFQITASLEQKPDQVEPEVFSELAHYGLDLLDRLEHQLKLLGVEDQKDNLSRVYGSMAIWMARHGAVLENLRGTAEGLAHLVNGLQNASELATLCRHINEVIESASEQLQLDADKENPWRPWRVLNLNAGVAATRSLNTQLMQETFDRMGQRLPDDMPTFFADGKEQLVGQADVPDEVHALMNQYAMRWADSLRH